MAMQLGVAARHALQGRTAVQAHPFLTATAAQPHVSRLNSQAALPSTSPSSRSGSVAARGCGLATSAEALAADPKMMCYQCEQTKGGTGCTEIGICGKTPEVAALQDLLVYGLKGLGTWAHHARKVAGVSDPEVNHFVTGGLFSTLTNVNFDATRFAEYMQQCNELTVRMREVVAAAGAPPPSVSSVPWFSGLPHPAEWKLSKEQASDLDTLVDFGHQVGLIGRAHRTKNDTLVGLQELLTYGLKGSAAYAHHASFLGQQDEKVHADFQEFLAFLGSDEAGDVPTVLQKCLDVGTTNLRVMEMLDHGHREKLGTPQPTTVNTTPVPGKAILVTGHDLTDLKALLDQTEGTGINVYTHGEMLPGHSYPDLSKYKHLAGHWGGAWYKQKVEFPRFPGAILVTTNCVLDPPEGTYARNMFTTGETGVTGVDHVGHHDFSKLIEVAQRMPGFGADEKPKKPLTVGFGHEVILSVADKVLGALQEGNLRHLFLIGGCDGSEPTRRYYANLAKTMPQDCAVLTLGCGKFRLIDQDWGCLPNTELPRLMDMGQCNDAYGAIVVASKFAEAVGADSVNDLPLSLDISWFEQKAVAVLLTLLSLGVKNIRLGPALPAFVTPEALQVLVEGYGLKPADLKHPEADIEAMIATA